MTEHNQREINSILVILTASLGDVVRGFAVVKPLKEQFPNAKLTWLIEDKWKSIASCISGIDELLVFERKQGLKGVRKIFKDLHNQHFDVVLDMQRHLKSGLFSFFSGAKRRIGFAPRNSHEFNFIFNNEYIPYYETNYPKIYHYMHFADRLGAKWQEPLDFGFNLTNTNKSNAIGIVLGSSKVEKDWPKSSYLQLLQYLTKESQRPILLLGDSSQATTAAELIEAVDSQLITNMVGKTNLIQLTEVLATMAVVIGPDSGPGHISAAVKTPYIALFGPTNIQRVAPYGCENLALQTASQKVPDIAVTDVITMLNNVLSRLTAK